MPLLPHKLIFIRHGQTDSNVEKRFQGRKDIPLNSKGCEQARQIGRILLKEAPAATSFNFVSSPLIRARGTMELVRATMNLEPGDYHIAAELTEMSFGKWEGLTDSEIRQDRGIQELAAKETNPWGFVYPGGESYALVYERVTGWLERLNRDTLTISHAVVGRCVQAYLTGAKAQDVPAIPIPQGEPIFYSEGKVTWLSQ